MPARSHRSARRDPDPPTPQSRAPNPTWLELSTRAEAESVEAIAEAFQRWGQGVVIEEPIVARSDETYEVDYTQPVKVTTYLPLDERAEERQGRLEQALHWLGRLRPVEPLTVRTLVEADWENAWKRHFFVRHVGARLVIVPSWRRYRPRPGEVVLDLDPGMAFGTGVHPTTRLCLTSLERYIQPGHDILDYGTGSGILAIAAAKLGASTVLALDVDATAVRVATENVARNEADGIARISQGDLNTTPGTPQFDLILANINLRVIRESLPGLAARLRPGGHVILSGVLREHAAVLREAVGAAGLVICLRRREGDWLALAAQLP
jgi:ribosomal protein L11 methyltransferase